MSSQSDDIPPELLGFLHTCIDSVEGLQVLLLLLSGPSSVTAISDELRSSMASVLKRVHDLQRCQVLSPEALAGDGSVRFLPANSEVERVARELAALYRLRPHRVIAQIFARPSIPLQSFADAFRLKKENK